MPSTIDQGRGILGFLSPLAGTRATWKVRITPPAGSTGELLLSPNWWLYPTISGAIRADLAYRILPNYDREDLNWALPPEGALVDIEAHIGGARYNLEAGSVMRWADDVPDFFDIDGLVVGPDGITGGDDEPLIGQDKIFAVSFFENIGQAQIALDLYRSTISAFPAAILVWDSSAKSPSFVGRGKQLYSERFNLLIVCDRVDMDPKRRGEGIRLADKAQDLILWRTIYGDEEQRGGGIIVSAVSSTNIVGRFRLTTQEPKWSSFYIYGLRIEAMRVAQDVYSTRAQPWRKSRVQANTPETNFPTDPKPLPLEDTSVAMKQDDG